MLQWSSSEVEKATHLISGSHAKAETAPYMERTAKFCQTTRSSNAPALLSMRFSFDSQVLSARGPMLGEFIIRRGRAIEPEMNNSMVSLA